MAEALLFWRSELSLWVFSLLDIWFCLLRGIDKILTKTRIDIMLIWEEPTIFEFVVGCLVNCGDFPVYFSSIHGMRSAFICSEDDNGLFEVLADRFMVMEVILFKLLSLISLMVISKVGSGSNFSASIMLFILIWSKLSSKDTILLKIFFSCTRNCDGSLTNISLIASVASEGQSFS